MTAINNIETMTSTVPKSSSWSNQQIAYT